MDALALCTIETIQVREYGSRGSTRLRGVTAHRYLDFAVHRADCGNDLFSERWNITHVPSGHRAGHNFRSIEPALAAMVDIARLRNDWAVIEDDDAGRETADKVREIIKRHDPRADVGQGRNGEPLKNVLNGYAESRP